MNDDSQRPGDGADGWVDPYARTEFGLDAVQGPDSRPPAPTELAPPRGSVPANRNSVEEGKMMALLSHGSVLLGLPLFIIPMMQKDNEFALHHAKAAAVNFIFFLGVIMIGIVTCGLGLVLLPLPYIPMVIGAVNAANGDRVSGWAWGSTGERMFSGLQIDETKLLE